MALPGVGDFVPTVEVRTRFTPTVRLSTARGGGPSPIMKILAPTIIGRDANNGELFRIAPYGYTPESIKGTIILASVVVGTLALAFFAGRVSRG